MKIIIMFIYITIAVAQAAQGNYVTAAAIIVLYAINEIISEQRYHKLENKHNKAVASLHEDNVILTKTLSRTQMKLDAIRGHNHEQK